MKPVVFAGPSLYGVAANGSQIEVRPPARQGDILRAVTEGARMIGLIDGVFAAEAAVWHKEILYALSLDVRVLGAASMGALRAAECAPFGMEPVGVIADKYCRGELDDDAAVALTFGPAELGWRPLTLPLVDVDDFAAGLEATGDLGRRDALRLAAVAREIFYADRTLEQLLSRAFPGDAPRQTSIARAISSYGPSLKQRDALALLDAVQRPRAAVERWCKMAESPTWRQVAGGQAAAPVTGLSHGI
jgi:hypothetical protein